MFKRNKIIEYKYTSNDKINYGIITDMTIDRPLRMFSFSENKYITITKNMIYSITDKTIKVESNDIIKFYKKGFSMIYNNHTYYYAYDKNLGMAWMLEYNIINGNEEPIKTLKFRNKS